MTTLYGENFKSLAAERLEPFERPVSPAQASEPSLGPAAAGPSSYGTPVGGATRDSPGSGDDVDGAAAGAAAASAPGARPGVVSPGSGLGVGPPSSARVSSPPTLMREMLAPYDPQAESLQAYIARVTSLQGRLHDSGQAVDGTLFEQLLQTADLQSHMHHHYPTDMEGRGRYLRAEYSLLYIRNERSVQSVARVGALEQLLIDYGFDVSALRTAAEGLLTPR